MDVALDEKRNVYVLDNRGHNVQKFSPDGSFLLRFGSEGADDGQFNKPFGIAVDDDESIYVADTYNHRVQKFDANGRFLAKYGSRGFGKAEHFLYPRKVAIGRDGYIFVLDGFNHRIQKITEDGVFLPPINSKGLGPGNGQFAYPLGMTLDAEDNIYITDPNNALIQKLDANGSFLMQFGTLGAKEGQFDWPYGIGVDANQNIYVADTDNDRIQKFNSEGAFVARFGSELNSEGEFRFPVKPALDSKGNIYVLDVLNENIQKFNNSGEFLNRFGADEGYEGRIPGRAIATDKEDYLYVINTSNFSIQKYHSDGKLINEFDYRGYGPLGSYIKPTALSIDLEGNVYVVQESGPRIQKFTNNGEFLFQFVFPDSLEMHFYRATGITTDQEGNLYISDSGGWNIKKFDSEGNFTLKFGSRGSSDGQFEYPTDVAVDKSGNIYVCDRENLIQKFSSDGTFLAKISSFGLEEGQLRYPSSLQVDSHENIYVVDLGNRRIQKFRLYPSNFSFFSDTAKGYSNEVVEINIKANDFSRIISAQATLEWNPKIAKFLSAGAVSLPYTQFNNTFADQGKITFSWYERSNSGGLSLADSSVLFTLRFRLIGEPEEQTALSFTSSLTPLEVADKDDKIVTARTIAGQLHILPLQTISGNIFTEANQPIKNVRVMLTGYASDEDSTDTDGEFEVSGVHPFQTYTIATSKQHSTNYANGLTSLDLAIIQRHILETEMLSSPYKLIAADVDLSESITTADIIDLQDVVLGNTDCLAKNKHWTFIPESFVFTDPTHPYPYDTALVYDTMPSRTGHNFIGIKLGDVNDTWDPARGRRQQKQIKFFVEQHQTLTEGTITVPVKVADFKDVSSFQFTLEWNKDVLIFESAQGKELPEIVFGEKYTEDGQLTVLWYDLQGSSISLSDEQVAFTITFKTKGRIGDQSAVSLSSARTPLLAYDTTNTEMNTEAISGVVEIVQVLGLSESLKPTSYKLYQNEPNPFTNSVKLKFALPHKSLVVLRVMNATGQALYEVENTFEQGTHIILWDGKSSQGMTLHSGVYFVQFVADSFHETIKVIKR